MPPPCTGPCRRCDDDGYVHDDSATAGNDYHDRMRPTRDRRCAPATDAATDLGLYFEEGNRCRRRARSPGRVRRSAAPPAVVQAWQEPKAPDFAAEVLSERTWQVRRRQVRPDQELGVWEFRILDVDRQAPPTGGRDARNAAGVYEPIPPLPHGGPAVARQRPGCSWLTCPRQRLPLRSRFDTVLSPSSGTGAPLLAFA